MTTTEFKTLMTRHLLGITDEDEEKQLCELLQSDSEYRSIASEFCELKEISKKFEQYHKVDSKLAFDKFNQIVDQETFVDKKLVSTSRWWNRTTARVAAALIPLFVIGSVIYFIYNKDNTATETAKTDIPYTSVPPSRENPLLRSEEEDKSFTGFDKKEEKTTAYNTVNTTRANYCTFTLEDGTRIQLDACSSVTYPERFTGNTREVTLKGEAYFEIAKDANRPFIVHVAGTEVKQYGTQFNINAYDEKNIKVTLVRGSIGVTAKGGTEKMLTPDHSALISHDGVSIFPDDVMLATEWMHGTHHFKNASVQQLSTLLQRMYTQNVTLTDDASTPLSGVFNQEDNLCDITEAINCVTDHMPIESDKGAKDEQTRRVTMILKGVSGRTFLDILHKKTGISYVFDANEINHMAGIIVKADNETLENVLNRVFTNSKFQYRLRGNVLTVKYNKNADTTPPVLPAKKNKTL